MSTEAWHFDAASNAVLDENRLTVCLVQGDTDIDGPLLAAAPQLLAALKRITEDRGYFPVDAMQAIALAEGREP